MNNTHPKLVPQPYTNLLTERDVTRRPILETRHLGIDFGGLTAVSDFNIAIGATEIAGLIGPNGAASPRQGRPRSKSTTWVSPARSRTSACSAI